MYAVNAVHFDRLEVHPALEKPMAVSAAYSRNITKEIQDHKKLHNELARIRESVQASDQIL